MRIVHFIFSFQTGGSETMLVDIINEQVRNNTITLIILNDQVNEQLLNQIDGRVKIIKIGRLEKSRNLMPVIRLNWHLFILHPDIIHCHSYSAAGVIFFKRNILLTAHTINIPVKYHNRYRKIFAISGAVKKDIEKRCNIKPIVINNGIDIKKVKEKTDYNYSIFKIVQVSRMDHEKKGQHILIEAMNILINQKWISNIKIDFIGDGASFDYLERLVLDYKLEKQINFLGFRDREYIYEHLRDYNLLVQPSLYEGFGLTIVEGMAAKVPVLVSDIDGPAEVVQEGKFGWIFKSGSEVDCANQIFNIIQTTNSQTFFEKVEAAYEYANTSFSIENTAACYSNEYQ